MNVLGSILVVVHAYLLITAVADDKLKSSMRVFGMSVYGFTSIWILQALSRIGG